MRIVIIRSNPIDPDSRVEKETETLMADGNAVTILGWDRKENYSEKKSHIYNRNGYAEVYRFGIKAGFGAGKKNLFALIKYQKCIYRWLKNNKNRFDAIHACDFDTGLISEIMAKRLNKLFIYDIFDYYSACRPLPRSLSSLIRRLENQVITHADATIICSEQRKEQIKGSRPKRLIIIHNAPSMRLLNQTNESFKLKSSGTGRIKIGYVGILGNTQRLLDEIAYAIANRDDVEYHVGGFGQLESFFQNMELKYENIFYYSKLPYYDTLRLEEQMDIITAIYDPSVSNNQYAAPNKLYEGLMLGKPLLMVHNTGMDKIVEKI